MQSQLCVLVEHFEWYSFMNESVHCRPHSVPPPKKEHDDAPLGGGGGLQATPASTGVGKRHTLGQFVFRRHESSATTRGIDEELAMTTGPHLLRHSGGVVQPVFMMHAWMATHPGSARQACIWQRQTAHSHPVAAGHTVWYLI
jgi:hypothetical protein